MTEKKTSSNGGDLQHKVMVGAGITAALAATAAGVYFLYGKNGTKNRKKIKSWMLKAKGEVMESIEGLKDVSEETYHTILKNVESKYKAMKDVEPEELVGLMNELKGYWKLIKRDATPKTKTRKAAK